MSQCIYHYHHIFVRARAEGQRPKPFDLGVRHFSRSGLHATWRVPLAMPAIALATGKIASLLD